MGRCSPMVKPGRVRRIPCAERSYVPILMEFCTLMGSESVFLSWMLRNLYISLAHFKTIVPNRLVFTIRVAHRPQYNPPSHSCKEKGGVFGWFHHQTNKMGSLDVGWVIPALESALGF